MKWFHPVSPHQHSTHTLPRKQPLSHFRDALLHTQRQTPTNGLNIHNFQMISNYIFLRIPNVTVRDYQPKISRQQAANFSRSKKKSPKIWLGRRWFCRKPNRAKNAMKRRWINRLIHPSSASPDGVHRSSCGLGLGLESIWWDGGRFVLNVPLYECTILIAPLSCLIISSRTGKLFYAEFKN